MLRHLITSLVISLCLLGPSQGWGQSRFLGQPPATWAKQLEDKEPNKRRSAAFALGRIGGDAQRFLGRLLEHIQNDIHPGVREMAAVSLGDIIVGQKDFGPVYWPELGPVLTERLDKETDSKVRRGLVYALGAFGPAAAPAAPALQKALADPSAPVRQNSAWALGRIGTQVESEAVIDSLCDLLKDDNALVRRDTATALGDIGLPRAQKAVLPLLDLIGRENKDDKGDPVVLKTALEKLIRLVSERNQDQSGRLYPFLRHEDPETARFAAFALSNIGGLRARPAVEVLRAALKDEDPQVQEVAAAALGNLGPVAKEGVPDLADALFGRALPVRRSAAIALGRIGPDAEPAVPQLAKVLRDVTQPAEHEVRKYAAEALFHIDYPATEKAIPTVIEIIRDQQGPGDLRQRCVMVLRHLRDLKKFGAEEVLTRVLDETARESLMVRYDTARVLAHNLREGAPKKTAETLLDMLRNKNLYLYQGTAARVEGGGSETGQAPATVEAGNGGDGRFMAAEALGWLGKAANKKEILDELEATAKEKDERLRAASQEALKMIRGR